MIPAALDAAGGQNCLVQQAELIPTSSARCSAKCCHAIWGPTADGLSAMCHGSLRPRGQLCRPPFHLFYAPMPEWARTAPRADRSAPRCGCSIAPRRPARCDTTVHPVARCAWAGRPRQATGRAPVEPGPTPRLCFPQGKISGHPDAVSLDLSHLHASLPWLPTRQMPAEVLRRAHPIYVC